MFFRRGSIVAEFQLIFKTKVTEEEALVELKRETANGKLGSLAVDPSSLKPTPAKQGEVLLRAIINFKEIYVICRPGGPYRKKLCPRSARQTKNIVFSYTDRPRPVNNIYLFFFCFSF